MNLNYLDTLGGRNPEWLRLLLNLCAIDHAARAVQLAPFNDAAVFLSWTPGASSPKCVSVDAPLANAFVGHVSQGSIRMLQVLTDPFLEQLKNDNYLCAAMLARPILEHSGRAAFALTKLNTMREMGSFEPLGDVIRQVLFGSSFTIKKLEGSIFSDFADIRASCPIKTSDYVEAMETFAGIRSANPDASFFKGVYALLCECTHATQQATVFLQRLESAANSLRLITYVDSPANDPEAQLALLKATIRCLQCGYAASCLLSCFEFEGVGDSLTLGNPPALQTARWIHENIMDPQLVFGTKCVSDDYDPGVSA